MLHVPASRATTVALLLATIASSIASPAIFREDVPFSKFVALGNRDEYRSVIAIQTASATAIGSGVMISPRWAITAAHIFSSDTAHYRVQIDSQFFDVDSVVIHPQYHPVKDSVFVDLALVRLSRAPENVAIAALATTPVARRTTIVSVGFGRSAGAHQPQASPSGVRHAVENVIDTFGVAPRPRSYIGSDLDNPNDPSMSVTGTGDALPLEGITNGGDSGGGMFVRSGAAWQLAGVVATGEFQRSRLEAFDRFGFYGSLSFWTKLDDQVDWIRKHTQTR